LHKTGHENAIEPG